MPDWTMDSVQALRGKDVYSTDGEKIGSVQEIYYDEANHAPEWIGLGTGFFGMKRKVVPIDRILPEQNGIYLPFTKDEVAAEPDFDYKDGISSDEERALCDYFSLGRHEEHSPRVLRPDEQYRAGY